jgi:hypothetical protein
MDEIKIRNLKAEHPGKPLPEFRHRDRAECELLRATLATKLGLSWGSDGLEVLCALELRAIDIPGVRPSEEDFVLAGLFSRLQLQVTNVFVNWSRFDDIDEMSLSALSDAFHDLWYPSSDDIEIFDQDQKWVLLIRHFDVAQLAKGL